MYGRGVYSTAQNPSWAWSDTKYITYCCYYNYYFIIILLFGEEEEVITQSKHLVRVYSLSVYKILKIDKIISIFNKLPQFNLKQNDTTTTTNDNNNKKKKRKKKKYTLWERQIIEPQDANTEILLHVTRLLCGK